MIRAVALLALLSLAPQDAPKKRDGALFGLKFRDLTPAERREIGLRAGGVRVTSVQTGSNAEKIGFKAGDSILSIGENGFRHADEFIGRLWDSKYDYMMVAREKRTIDIDVKLDQLDAGPKAGDRAPDFSLKTEDGKSEIRLSKLIGKRPVVLVFGSYT